MTQPFNIPSAPSPAPASRLWIQNPLAAFTANSLDASGGLVISGGRIVEVLGAGQTPSAPCQQTFDAGSHVLLPGLINTHHHFYQTLTRAWGPVANAPLFPWLHNLYPVWARLTPRDLELASHRGPRRTAALRLHHRRRPPLPLPGRDGGPRSTSRSVPCAGSACGPR